MIKKLLFICFLNLFFLNKSFAWQNIFYVLRSSAPTQIVSTQEMLSDLSTHAKKIDLVISQAYQIDKQGLVWGYMDPAVIEITHKNKIKLMAMVTNTHFDKKIAHEFLQNNDAKKSAIQSLLEACKKNNLAGIQFDFEMIALADRDALTSFYQEAAKVLHAAGYQASFAIGPLVSDNPQASDYLKKLYEVWEGAYDLPKLASHADFITVMAYNQHGEGTSPGPTAGSKWVEAVIQYSLKYIPANKLSLGVPLYSNYWYTGSSGSHIRFTMTDVTYEQVKYLLKKYQAKISDNSNDHFHYSIYDHNWLDEYLFIEDAYSLKSKIDLAKKYHLHGISAFYLGAEDQKIWDVL